MSGCDFIETRELYDIGLGQTSERDDGNWIPSWELELEKGKLERVGTGRERESSFLYMRCWRYSGVQITQTNVVRLNHLKLRSANVV